MQPGQVAREVTGLFAPSGRSRSAPE